MTVPKFIIVFLGCLGEIGGPVKPILLMGDGNLKTPLQDFDTRFRTSRSSSIHNLFPQERGLAREGHRHRVLNAVIPQGFTINAMPF